MDAAISYRSDPAEPGKYNAMFRLPGERHFRIGLDVSGGYARYDSSAEAEASAGHRLALAINRERR